VQVLLTFEEPEPGTTMVTLKQVGRGCGSSTATASSECCR